MSLPTIKRVLLKLSGEVLMGGSSSGSIPNSSPSSRAK